MAADRAEADELEGHDRDVAHEHADAPPDRRNEHEVDQLVPRVLMIRAVEAQFLVKAFGLPHGVGNHVKEPKPHRVLREVGKRRHARRRGAMAGMIIKTAHHS